MKALLTALTLAMLASEAQAISRYHTSRLTCDEARARIADEGVVILRWQSPRDPSLPIYNRFVRSGQYCKLGEAATRRYIPTADCDNCPVLECKPMDFGDDIWRHRRR